MQFACAKCEKPVSLVEPTAGVAVSPEVRCDSCGASWPNKWWVVIRGDKRGPMTVAELVASIERREVEGRTFVWTTGFGPWIRAAQVEALKSVWVELASAAAANPEPARRTPTAQSARPALTPKPEPPPTAPVEVPAASPAATTLEAEATGVANVAFPPATSVVANPPTGSGLRPRLHLRSMPPPSLPLTGAAPRPSAAIESPGVPSAPLASSPAAPALPEPAGIAEAGAGTVTPIPLTAVASATESGAPLAVSGLAPQVLASPDSLPVPPPALPVASIETPGSSPLVSPVAETLLIRADTLVTSSVPVPEGGDAHHEDLFFAGASAGAKTSGPGSDAARRAVDLIDLKHVLDDLKNADGRHVAAIGTSPTGFSMVTRIHRPDRRRWFIMGGVVVVLAAAAILAVVLQPPSDPTPRVQAPVVASNLKGGEAAKPVPKAPAVVAREEPKPTTPEKPDLALTAKVDGAVGNASGGASTTTPVTSNVKTLKPKGTTEPPKTGAGSATDGANHGLTKEQFAALTEDDVGKQEVKLEFDPGAAARKAADDAAAKQRAAASNLAQDVAGAFGKKKTQFARCSDGSQERVRLVFTVQPSGKVANTRVEGTSNTAKAQCLTEILGRAIFPANSEPATYSQVLVL